MLKASDAREMRRNQLEVAQLEPVIDSMLRAHIMLGHAWPAQWHAPEGTRVVVIAAVKDYYEHNGWNVGAIMGIGCNDAPVFIGLSFTLTEGR